MTTAIILYILFLGLLLLASVAGLMIYKQTPGENRPLIFFVWTLLLLKTLETFFDSSNAILRFIGQAEILLQLFFISWQAKRWRVFDRRPWLFWTILATGLVCWILERVLISGTSSEISWAQVVCCFMITLMGIELLGSTVLTGNAPLNRNPVFLFSVGIILYYTFSGLLEVFMIIGQYSSAGMLHKAYYFYVALGILTHFIYLRTVLCIPTKKSYS